MVVKCMGSYRSRVIEGVLMNMFKEKGICTGTCAHLCIFLCIVRHKNRDFVFISI